MTDITKWPLAIIFDETQALLQRGGGVLPYIIYICMCRPIGYGFYAVLVWKRIRFAHFGLESDMVFKESTGVYERIYRFNSKWVRKKEKHANSKWIWRIFFFRSNLSSDNIISANRPGLKTGVENCIFWSEIGSGFGDGTPSPRIPRSTPGQFCQT